MSKSIKNYLVVADIDGTFLEAGYGIPDANMKAVDDFIARGGNFTFCTGRSVDAVKPVTEFVRINKPAILCGGGQIYDFNTEKTLYSLTLAPAVKTLSAELVKKFPSFGLEITATDGIYISHMTETIDHTTSIRHFKYCVCDLADVPENWYKAVFSGPEEEVVPLINFCKGICAKNSQYKDINVTRTGKNFVELTPKGTDKASGLIKLCSLIGINRAMTVAVCDYYNDEALLKAAGTKITVANAPSEVRAMSDFTVSSCLKGGVAEVLNRFEDVIGDYEQLSLLN